MSTTTTKTNANLSTENALDVEVSSVLWHTGEPADCPLLTLLGGELYEDGQSRPKTVKGRIRSEVSKENSYKLIEKDPLARTVVMNGAVADTTTGTFTVVASGNLTANVIIRNQSTGELAYVYTVTSATAIVVNRNLGSTSFTVGATDTWKVVGYAAAEGQAKRTMKSQLAAARMRYCQIFKTAWGVTGTADKVQLVVDVNAWDEEQLQAAVNHKKDMEFSAWWNPYADSTTDASSNTVYLSRGIIAELSNNSREFSCDGNMTEDVFFSLVAEKIFQYGPSKKMLFADAKFRSKVNGWSRNKVQQAVKENVYGMSVNTLETGHGTLEMVAAGVLDEFLADADKGYAVVLDVDRIRKRYISGRDAKIETDIQTPGTDAREGQIFSEVGFSVLSLAHHSIINKIG